MFSQRKQSILLRNKQPTPKSVRFADVLDRPPKSQSMEFTFGSFSSRFDLDSLGSHRVFSSSGAKQSKTTPLDHSRVHRATDVQARSKVH
jgi:hypothetical protein